MDEKLEILMSAVKQAASAVLGVREQGIGARYRAKGDLVTRADEASHALIKAKLNAHFPTVPFVLEEQTNVAVPEVPFIVGDELDGTIPFARGMKEWGISLSYIEHVPTRGVIYMPEWGILVSALKGKGCWINGRRCVISHRRSLDDAVWGTELNPFLTDEHRKRYIDRLSKRTHSTRCLACASAGIVELLCGRTDFYVNCRGGKIWDFAAGVLAVEEAGGAARRINGALLSWDTIAMDIVLASHVSLLEGVLHVTSE